MLNTRIALRQIKQFIQELEMEKEITISKAILFGSVSKGTSHKDSDIDLAIWSPHFIGCIPIDLELFANVKSRYPLLEVHTFSVDEDRNNNPMIEEIEKTGILLELDSIPHSSFGR
jgi:predicted nucleotidyltransferase